MRALSSLDNLYILISYGNHYVVTCKNFPDVQKISRRTKTFGCAKIFRPFNFFLIPPGFSDSVLLCFFRLRMKPYHNSMTNKHETSKTGQLKKYRIYWLREMIAHLKIIPSPWYCQTILHLTFGQCFFWRGLCFGIGLLVPSHRGGINGLRIKGEMCSHKMRRKKVQYQYTRDLGTHLRPRIFPVKDALLEYYKKREMF